MSIGKAGMLASSTNEQCMPRCTCDGFAIPKGIRAFVDTLRHACVTVMLYSDMHSCAFPRY